VKQPAMKAEERAERIVYGRLGLDDVVEHIRAAEQAALERAAQLADEHWHGPEPGSPGDYIRAMMQPSN
jgi:hypothetical protein